MFVEEIDKATIRAMREFDRSVVRPGQMQLLERAFFDFEMELRDVYNSEVADEARRAMEALVDRGARAGGLATGFSSRIGQSRVAEALVETSRYYVRNHVTRNIMPLIEKLPEKVVAQGLDGVEALKYISDEMEQIVGRVSHNLRLTANQAASRAYHYGVMKGGFEAGQRYYAFEAILDENTSVVCENLNGRVFSVADAIDVAERRALSAPEDLRANAPWYKAESVTGLDNAAIVAIGANLPPLHPFCRSSIRFVGNSY